MRGHFVKKIQFNDDDIIISVDADEIIYGDKYQQIISSVINNGPTLLKLRQFFYKYTYHWYNNDFIAPTAIKYRDFKNNYPCQLRYMGTLMEDFVGCHFSWCMTPTEMIYKLETYSHPKYRFCADLNLLENAVKNKTYPFDESTDFKINELGVDDPILPKKIKEIIN